MRTPGRGCRPGRAYPGRCSVCRRRAGHPVEPARLQQSPVAWPGCTRAGIDCGAAWANRGPQARSATGAGRGAQAGRRDPDRWRGRSGGRRGRAGGLARRRARMNRTTCVGMSSRWSRRSRRTGRPGGWVANGAAMGSAPRSGRRRALGVALGAVSGPGVGGSTVTGAAVIAGAGAGPTLSRSTTRRAPTPPQPLSATDQPLGYASAIPSTQSSDGVKYMPCAQPCQTARNARPTPPSGTCIIIETVL